MNEKYVFERKRLCRKCNVDLPLTTEHFTPRKTDKSGFNLYCKECINKEKREKRLEKRKISNKGGTVLDGSGRKCTICKNIYPETNDYFGKHKLNIKGLDSYCKECRRNRNLNNFYKAQDKWKETHKKTALLKKENIISIKENSDGCCKCKEKRHYLLDFHHLDPNTKLFQIGQGESKGWNKILEEIKKCILLCSNCHREFHYLEKTQDITFKEYLKDFKSQNS